MLVTTQHGLFCPDAGVFIDPWHPVERAVVTHAHGDHARPGCANYLCCQEGIGVLRERIGQEAHIAGLPYGKTLRLNDVELSFHPAGHVLGSAQIRLSRRGEVWVVSGDYKTHSDPTCTAWEPVECHTFVTESTFGLPIYRWFDPTQVFREIHDWWRGNQASSKTSVLFGYALGKAQRILAGLEPETGPILVHETVDRLLPAYRAAGIRLPETHRLTPEAVTAAQGRALLIAPPFALDDFRLRAFGEIATAFASGWMLLRGTRRRRGVDRGFVLSDHVDWPSLLQSIRLTRAERILATHGYTHPLVRWLNENGWKAEALETHFGTETDTDAATQDQPAQPDPATEEKE